MPKDQSIKLEDLALILDEYLNISDIPDSCPNGLQVEGKKVIKKVGVGVSASLATIVEAIMGITFLISMFQIHLENQKKIIKR